METSQSLLFSVTIFTTWWWLLLANTAFFGSIILILKESDHTLKVWKAITLSFAGVVNIIPLVRKLVPDIVVIDFSTRWLMADMRCSFRSFVLFLSFVSFFLAPVVFFVTVMCWLFDNITVVKFRKRVTDLTTKLRLKG